MTTKAYGLYIHIPFCKKRCSYCDFCSSTQRYDKDIDGYIGRLRDELIGYKSSPNIILDTIYFGGGTPSLLEPERLHRILSVVHSVFDVKGGAEITVEANPGTITPGKASGLYSMGINRVSMGLQSIHENELKKLGRIHTYEDFLLSYNMLRKARIDNINIDLMYGIPLQTKESFRQTLDEVIALDPEHISAYGLIVEPGTPFYEERDTLDLPTEEDECDMYYTASERLGRAGYLHYEISNYAKPDKQSRHNLKYWRDEEYIGVGASAYSYYGGKRYGNTSDLDEYLGATTLVESTEIAPEDMAYEYAMMRLRLREGFHLSDYKERFSKSFTSGKEALIERYLDLGLMSIKGDRISLTDKGFYVSSSILAELL